MSSAAYFHARDRLQERYGLTLRQQDYDHLCTLIAQTLHLLSIQVCGAGRYELCVPFQGVPVRWVWDVVDGCLVTALPMMPRRQSGETHFSVATRAPMKRREPRRYQRRFRLEDEHA